MVARLGHSNRSDRDLGTKEQPESLTPGLDVPLYGAFRLKKQAGLSFFWLQPVLMMFC